MAMTPGPLALVGGDEFHRGNDEQVAMLVDAAAGRPAFLIATAAADAPEQALATAQRWFRRFDIDIQELRARTAAEAKSPETAELAATGGLFYIAGGDPGRVAKVLRGSPVWDAVRSAWLRGAALAGSSAGAMALCRWTLVRAGWPGHTARRPLDALDVVPEAAVLPHYDTFGDRWIPSAQEALGPDTLLIGVDERSAAVWRDREWIAVGPGSVTLVRGPERRSFNGGDPIEGLPQPSE